MTAFVEFFVEEASMEALLYVIVPMIRPDMRFNVHAFAGVDDMMKKLPARFRGYSGWMPEEWKLVVIRDEDRRDCKKLKGEIERMARRARLTPKGRGDARRRFQVLTRIAVEELEAWLLGDVPALAATYSRVPPTLANQRAFRNADEIEGGTWEALERVLNRAGHFFGGLPKIQVAREVAANMDPDRNTSRSFRIFREGLRSL